MRFFSLCQSLYVMTESLLLLSNLKRYSNRIEEVAYNPIYNEALMIEIEHYNGFYLIYMSKQVVAIRDSGTYI
jgi:hypothetical protein